MIHPTVHCIHITIQLSSIKSPAISNAHLKLDWIFLKSSVFLTCSVTFPRNNYTWETRRAAQFNTRMVIYFFIHFFCQMNVGTSKDYTTLRSSYVIISIDFEDLKVSKVILKKVKTLVKLQNSNCDSSKRKYIPSRYICKQWKLFKLKTSFKKSFSFINYDFSQKRTISV